MRCPNCMKFVSYDEPEVESSDVSVNGSEVIHNARVVLKCAECGTELKDAEIAAEAEVDHNCSSSDTPLFEISNEGDCTATDRLETKDRRGKPIKSARYMKRFYGFEADHEIECGSCGEKITVAVSGEESASGFNELA